MSSAFPYEIKNVNEDEDKIIRKYYNGYIRPFIRIGPSGYLSPPRYQDHAADIYSLDVRSDDIWICTFSRSGTTWLQELVWLVNNNLDYETAKSTSVTRRYAFIEFPIMNAEVGRGPPQFSTRSATEQDFRTLPELTSPRYVKTHLPLSLLPPNLTDVCKVFYVARHPLDVAVSFFFMHKMFGYFNEDVKFKEYWELFKKDLLMHLPIFPHVDEAWQKRKNPNLLFLFYEEMKKDLRGVISRVCEFLGKEYTSDQKDKLAEHLDFDNMKKSSHFSKISKSKNEELQFMRKGKSGHWVNYFDEEMKKEAEEFLKEYFKNTDMRFPEV